MLATLVIFLREGVEASMIVAILLAYLTIRSYDGSRVQTIFETATYLVAAAVLTYMTFWMRDHARSLSSELRKRTDAALDGRARWGLGLLAFQAVGREGLETVVFTLAIVFSTSAASAMGGAAIGLAGALGIAFVIYRLGHRLNLGRFFTVIGVLLMAFAAGLLANVVENLQQLGWLPMLTGPLWHSGRILSEDSSFGDVLHSFFGYSDAPTILQILVYFGYLAIVIIAYLGLASRLRRYCAAGRPGTCRGAGRQLPAFRRLRWCGLPVPALPGLGRRRPVPAFRVRRRRPVLILGPVTSVGGTRPVLARCRARLGRRVPASRRALPDRACGDAGEQGADSDAYHQGDHGSCRLGLQPGRGAERVDHSDHCRQGDDPPEERHRARSGQQQQMRHTGGDQGRADRAEHETGRVRVAVGAVSVRREQRDMQQPAAHQHADQRDQPGHDRGRHAPGPQLPGVDPRPAPRIPAVRRRWCRHRGHLPPLLPSVQPALYRLDVSTYPWPGTQTPGWPATGTEGRMCLA